MILDSSLWDRMLGSGSHSLIALSMHDRFWYRCLGDATHLLLGVSVCTLGHKVRLNSHSLMDYLFPCLIWDSGSHSFIALSMYDRLVLVSMSCNSHAPWCISLHIGTKSKAELSQFSRLFACLIWGSGSHSLIELSMYHRF